MRASKAALLAAAHEYLRRGLPITLCAGDDGKKPLGHGWTATSDGTDWGTYRWSEAEINRAFRVRGPLNVGMPLGMSSGLIVIEADDKHQERAFVELFDSDPPVTPTFKSRRGKVRIVRWDDALKETGNGVVHFRKLGIRIGTGGKAVQQVLPPSINEDGTSRRWLVSLDDCPPAPFPDLVIKRILKASKVDTSRVSRTVSTMVASPRGNSPSVSTLVNEAIWACIPEHEGVRNDKIFELARRLHGIRELTDVPQDTLKPIFARWHRAARPYVQTKDFGKSWRDFTRARNDAKYPFGHGPIDEALAKSEKLAAESPPAAALRYQKPRWRVLVCLCYLLQSSAGSEAFFVDNRTVGRLLGVSHTTAWKDLKQLISDGIVQVVAKQDRTRKLSMTYRYVAVD